MCILKIEPRNLNFEFDFELLLLKFFTFWIWTKTFDFALYFYSVYWKWHLLLWNLNFCLKFEIFWIWKWIKWIINKNTGQLPLVSPTKPALGVSHSSLRDASKRCRKAKFSPSEKNFSFREILRLLQRCLALFLLQRCLDKRCRKAKFLLQRKISPSEKYKTPPCVAYQHVGSSHTSIRDASKEMPL